MTDHNRKVFEDACCQRWAGDRGALTIRADGEYVNGSVQFAWIAFQWGINHAAKLLAEEVEWRRKELAYVANEAKRIPVLGLREMREAAHDLSAWATNRLTVPPRDKEAT